MGDLGCLAGDFLWLRVKQLTKTNRDNETTEWDSKVEVGAAE